MTLLSVLETIDAMMRVACRCDDEPRIERLAADLLTAAPLSMRCALWENVWRAAAHGVDLRDVAIDAATVPPDAAAAWPPQAQNSAARVVATLCAKSASNHAFLVPCADVLALGRAGLSCIAEHSRHADVIVPAAVVCELLLPQSQRDEAVALTAAPAREGSDRNELRDRAPSAAALDVLRVVFPPLGKAPPRKVLVLSPIDEMRLLSAAASRSRCAPDAPAAVMVASALLAAAPTAVPGTQVTVGVISRNAQVHDACARIGMLCVR